MSTFAYISQLTPQEQKVLKIATEHLESSFNIVKSIGYQEWLKTNTTGTSADTKAVTGTSAGTGTSADTKAGTKAGTGTGTGTLSMKPLLSKL